jgi:hypothetical protein
MVLLAAMASHLALEDPEAALALWHHHVDGSRDDVRVRWIAAHAAQQAAWQLERFVGSPSTEDPPNRIER